MSTRLFVSYESWCTDSYHAGEEYGEWHVSSIFSVRGVSLLKSEHFTTEEFEIPQNVKVGDHVYVLWMTYSEGDSFGHSNGNGEIIWVFPTHELAESARKLWKDSKEMSIEFDIGDGHSKKLNNPAWGYFENLESIHVHSFFVTK